MLLANGRPETTKTMRAMAAKFLFPNAIVVVLPWFDGRVKSNEINISNPPSNIDCIRGQRHQRTNLFPDAVVVVLALVDIGEVSVLCAMAVDAVELPG